MNKLYYGDCLQIMNDMPNDHIDLIYLDPPFNSNRNYNAIYEDNTGQKLPEQIEAFCDVWEFNEERQKAIEKMPILMAEAGLDHDAIQLWKLWLKALRYTQPRLLAYLSYMTERLLVMKGLLKPTGSIYYHCDPTASHYIKVLMDAIFGHANFQNEIIWHYSGWNGKLSTSFNSRHDVIFYYSKGKNPSFNSYSIPWDSEEEYIKVRRQKVHVDNITGRKYVLSDRGKGNRIKRFIDEAMNYGKPIDDVWAVAKINNSSGEWLGYPTQKPTELLKRIILAGTKENDVVLDPFCGCATTIAAAHELNRQWIGIDIAYHAINRVVKARLDDVYSLKENIDYDISGVPSTRESALDLWERDKHQFARWAIETVDGFVSVKKSGDGGIDGNIYMNLPDIEGWSHMVIQVKGGANIGIKDVRDLRGTLERDGAEFAGLIIRDELKPQQKRNFDIEMLDAGFIGDYPRMQILTLDDILAGKKFNIPYLNVQGLAKSSRQAKLI